MIRQCLCAVEHPLVILVQEGPEHQLVRVLLRRAGTLSHLLNVRPLSICSSLLVAKDGYLERPATPRRRGEYSIHTTIPTPMLDGDAPELLGSPRLNEPAIELLHGDLESQRIDSPFIAERLHLANEDLVAPLPLVCPVGMGLAVGLIDAELFRVRLHFGMEGVYWNR